MIRIDYHVEPQVLGSDSDRSVALQQRTSPTGDLAFAPLSRRDWAACLVTPYTRS